MAKTVQTRVAGTWRNVKAVSVKVSGTWRNCKQVYVKVAGVWKELLAAGAVIVANMTTNAGENATVASAYGAINVSLDKLYFWVPATVSFGNGTLYQYDLASDYVISGASLQSSLTVSGSNMFGQGGPGIFVTPDSKTVIFAVGSNNLIKFGKIVKSTKDSSLSGPVYSQKTISGYGTVGGVFSMSADGVYLVFDAGTNDAGTERNLLRYQLSTPFNPASTWTFIDSFNYEAYTNSCETVTFSEDGLYLYILNSDTQTVTQFEMSSPYNLASIPTSGGIFSSITIGTTINSFALSPANLQRLYYKINADGGVGTLTS